jgi:hypothetical protein
MLKRHAVVGAAVVALAVFVTTASADPINAKTSLAFPAYCGNQTLNVVVNGAGNFAAAHDVDSNSTFTPQYLDITSVFTPTGGPAGTPDSGINQKPKLHGDYITCTFDTIQTFPNGTLHLYGTVIGVLTPSSD